VRLRVDQNLRIAFLSLAYKLQDLPTLPVLLAGVKDAGQKKNVCPALPEGPTGGLTTFGVSIITIASLFF